MDLLDDIATPRLVLRLMGEEATAACLAGDLARARRLLGAAIPEEVLERTSSLEYGQARLAEDAQYRPWSTRAMILPQSSTMIGHIRFHGRPDAEGAVEFGYRVFTPYRGHGYATEAARAVMQWAHATFGVGRFIASVAPDNHPSLRLIARLGFVRVGSQMDEIDGPEDVFLCVLPDAAAP
jgi:[ribosomal protein S5]-alanine N-acetyltransferase